jgi:hypothetical protein
VNFQSIHSKQKQKKFPPKFDKVLGCYRDLHEGCNTYTRLAFNIRHLYVKSYGRITNRAFDLIMQLLCANLPWVNFPKLYADAKLSEVGLGYQTIHVCKFNCSLF